MGRSQSKQRGIELDSLTEALQTQAEETTTYFLKTYETLRQAGPVEAELERALLVQHFIELVKQGSPSEALLAARQHLMPFRHSCTRVASGDKQTNYISIQEVLGLLCYDGDPSPALQPLLSASQAELVLSLLSKRRRKTCCWCCRRRA